MNKEQLLDCADFLEALPEEGFDYGTFGYKTDCGTKACAAGRLLIGDKLPGYKPRWERLDDGNTLWLTAESLPDGIPIPVFDAAWTALGLSEETAIALFLDSNSHSPKDSDEHLRIVARDGHAANVPLYGCRPSVAEEDE